MSGYDFKQSPISVYPKLIICLYVFLIKHYKNKTFDDTLNLQCLNQSFSKLVQIVQILCKHRLSSISCQCGQTLLVLAIIIENRKLFFPIVNCYF